MHEDLVLKQQQEVEYHENRHGGHEPAKPVLERIDQRGETQDEDREAADESPRPVRFPGPPVDDCGVRVPGGRERGCQADCEPPLALPERHDPDDACCEDRRPGEQAVVVGEQRRCEARPRPLHELAALRNGDRPAVQHHPGPDLRQERSECGNAAGKQVDHRRAPPGPRRLEGRGVAGSGARPRRRDHPVRLACRRDHVSDGIREWNDQKHRVLPSHEGGETGKRADDRVPARRLPVDRRAPRIAERRQHQHRRGVRVRRGDERVVHGVRAEPDGDRRPEGCPRVEKPAAQRPRHAGPGGRRQNAADASGSLKEEAVAVERIRGPEGARDARRRRSRGGTAAPRRGTDPPPSCSWRDRWPSARTPTPCPLRPLSTRRSARSRFETASRNRTRPTGGTCSNERRRRR